MTPSPPILAAHLHQVCASRTSNAWCIVSACGHSECARGVFTARGPHMVKVDGYRVWTVVPLAYRCFEDAARTFWCLSTLAERFDRL